MLLDGSEDGLVHWKPAEIGGCRGGTEVYQAEGIELCVGDRIRWTRNDGGLCRVNSQTAEVTAANGRAGDVPARGRAHARHERGRSTDPPYRPGWASTVHAFKGRTVDNVIAAIEANHANLTNKKSFYFVISRPAVRVRPPAPSNSLMQMRNIEFPGKR